MHFEELIKVQFCHFYFVSNIVQNLWHTIPNFFQNPTDFEMFIFPSKSQWSFAITVAKIFTFNTLQDQHTL